MSIIVEQYIVCVCSLLLTVLFQFLQEDYLHLILLFSRSDFKAVLREVRRNNGSTLSGLSLDNIASQVMAILDARTGGNPPATSSAAKPISAAGKPLIAGGVVSGKGKRRPIPRSPVPMSSKKMLPPVATAEPPKMSDIEYDNDGWCIICYEDMYDEDSSTLNCGHRFHSEVGHTYTILPKL